MSTSGESSNKWSSPSERPRHKHPARGARIAALVASVGATGALGVAFARSASSDEAQLAAATQKLAPTGAATGDAAAAPLAAATNPGESGMSIGVPEYTENDDEYEADDGEYESEDDYEADDDEYEYDDWDDEEEHRLPPPAGFPGRGGHEGEGGTPPSMPSAAAAPTQGATAGAASATADLNDGTFTGSSEQTPWGPVQVRITVAGGKVTDIETLAVPMSRKSGQINSRAVPVLQAQAVERQSAVLDTISGATWTSATYATSLQAALDASSTGSGAATGAAA